MIKYIFFILSASFLIVSSIFSGIPNNHFLVSHDEFIPISKIEVPDLFQVYDKTDFGYSAIASTLVTFHDRVYYSFAYMFSDDIRLIQISFYLFKITVLMLLSFLSLLVLSFSVSKSSSSRYFRIFMVALWYSFNPFTLVYWHSQAFSLTILFTYGLAPMALGLILNIFSRKSSVFQAFALSAILYFMSFGVYLFAAFVFSVFVFMLSLWFIRRINFRNYSKFLILLIFCSLPILSLLTLFLIESRFSTGITLSSAGGGTAGLLQGGLLNQFFLRFSWGVYTFWEPRNIYTFFNHFYSWPYILAVLLFYLIIFRFSSKIVPRLLFPILITLLVCFTLVKGAQSPFGFVYSTLIDNVSFFRVLRSPDNKFSFPIVLFLAFILLFGKKSKSLLYIFIPVLAFIQVWPIFTTEAFKGKNSDYSSTRYIEISPDMNSIANYINSNANGFDYILPIPHNSFGHYLLSDGRLHVGQDILAKLVHSPFVYINEHSGINKKNFETIKRFESDYDLSKLQDLPVKYILLRKDVRKSESAILKFYTNNSNLVPTFENESYVLFSNPNYLSPFCSKYYHFFSNTKVVLNSNNGCVFQNNVNNWRSTVTDSGAIPSLLLLFNNRGIENYKDLKGVVFFYPQALFELSILSNYLFLLLVALGVAYLRTIYFRRSV